MAELKANEIAMKDGRVIAIREITGADEIVVAAQLGSLFEANGGGAFLFQSCLIARSIETVDGKPVPSMKSYAEYRDFLGGFRGNDLRKIKEKYNEINGEGDEEQGKSSGLE